MPATYNIKDFSLRYEPVTESGCWIWSGATRKAYGVVKIQGKYLAAHRISWELHNGPIPDTFHVLHRCDVPCCVNPCHLFIGKNRENVTDKVTKNRQAKGLALPQTKLTEEQVRYILKSNSTNKQLGDKFNVGRGAIYKIRAGENWKHLLAE